MWKYYIKKLNLNTETWKCYDLALQQNQEFWKGLSLSIKFKQDFKRTECIFSHWQMSRDMTKPTKWACAQQRFRSPWHPIRIFAVLMKKPWVLSYPLSAHRRLRLGGCPGWSVSSLGAHSICWFCRVMAQIFIVPGWFNVVSRSVPVQFTNSKPTLTFVLLHFSALNNMTVTEGRKKYITESKGHLNTQLKTV